MREASADRLGRAAAFVSALAIVASVSFANGGYLRESWLEITLSLCALAGIVLLLRERIVLGRLDLLAVSAFAAFELWTVLSAVWSSAPTESLHDAERGLVYVAALLAFVLLVERETVDALLAGVAAGITVVCCSSLGQRLLATAAVPRTRLSGTRLDEPLGYANALGIVAALGIVLALGLIALAPTRTTRAVWTAVPVVLVATLVLTQSRGAILALAAGLTLFVVLEPRRAQLVAALLVLAIPSAGAALLTLHASALTAERASASDVTSAGRRLAVELALLVLVAALASGAVPPLAERLRRRKLSWTVPAVVGLALVGVVTVAVLGVHRALGPRVDYWRIAWHEFTGHRLLGSGAATFFQYSEQASIPVKVLDAHSLYIETLAELGVVGLALLVLVLALPLAGSLRRPGHALAAVATAAYVTFLVHAGIDWDWEIPAVTLTGVLLAVALLALARTPATYGSASLVRGVCAAAAFVLAALAVLLRLVVS